MAIVDRIAPLLRLAGRGRRLMGLALAIVPGLVASVAQAQSGAAPQATPPWPTTPPAAICGNAGILNGPATAPSGAVVVPAGSNRTFDFNRPGATFWFAPGVHTLGTGLYDQIIARTNTKYVGAPGAIIDGHHRNLYAFTGNVRGVTVAYLTIRNFGRGLDNKDEGVVNHDAGSNWTVEHNTIIGNDGAGVFIGSGNVVRYNCLKNNGQYGFSMYKPPVNGDSSIKSIVLDHNEITGNNTDDWERRDDGCGCTGGGKFWDVRGARVTANWVHGNKSVGLWADTNNIDFLFEGNLIEANTDEGLWYEISYNATIRGNSFRRNAWKKGHDNQGSPAAAIYLSESGGEPRLASAVSGAAKIRIANNYFEDNFSGVSIYENANRFCNSNGNTSTEYCTPLVSPTVIPEPLNTTYPNPINAKHPCYTQIAKAPYRTDCRWHSANIEVSGNEFRFDSRVVPCFGTYCGVQALMATGADNIRWSPYTVEGVQNDVMFRNGNRFFNNRYTGNWRFATAWGGDDDILTFAQWRAAPFGQDKGSTRTP